MAGCVTFWGQSRFDSPSPVLQASPGFQGLLGELRPRAGIGVLGSIRRLSLPQPQTLSLKKVPLASETQVRLGGSPRLKCSYSPPQTPCRLNRSFLVPHNFSYAYRTLAFSSVISSAGWCLPMSVAWRTFRPSIETKLTSSLPPLQLQDSSDHTAHVTKQAFTSPSRADCRFAEDRRRSPTEQPPPSQGVINGDPRWYIVCRLQRGGALIIFELGLYAHTLLVFLSSANFGCAASFLTSKTFTYTFRAGSPSILFQHEVPLHDHSRGRRVGGGH